ncbi:MAG TPA: fimbria/pilus periplasmic chaperone, partial [Geminicoccus sp.]|uniref:fimbria/pilus periplasmic chaperone n=1 Tax=Geminicoccus sp. TaxID=2024832 RepID=UPI002C38A79A
NLTVDTLLVDMADPAQSRRDLTLANTGSEKLYVQVDVEEMVATDEGREARTGSPDELGLLVTPNRLILEPGQRRPVRMVVLNRQVDRERMFRITLKPVVGDILSDEPAASNAPSAMIKVVVGYQAYLFVRPARIEESLLATRDGRQLQFRNAGNVSLLLDDGRQCADPTLPRDECTPLPSRRIYPGQSWSVELPNDNRAEYTVGAPSGRISKEF